VKKLSVSLLSILSLLLTLGFSQCQRPEEPLAPQPLLPKSTMVAMLIEVHLNESRVDAAALPPDSARAAFNQLQRKLLARYNVTDTIFQRSYRYYAIHDKDLDDIYGAVIDSLAAREAKLGASAEEQAAEAARNK
jgi:cAMP phosphodiesterase